MAKLLGLDKISKLMSIISENGGIRASLYKLYRMDDVKDGKLVGTDKYGNKYFTNPRYFYGRNRWVEYAPKYGMDYDGSQVPAEWYGWLHYKTDLLPNEDPSRPKFTWMADHKENMSGTSEQYVPYTTTVPKIHAWNPQAKTHG
ncbi:NADH dehydrogenase (ubiquinone) B17.2 subunit [Carabus blaptoides fortunei]